MNTDQDDKGLTPEKKILKQALEDFKNVSEWDQNNRKNYEDDTKFAHGDQWPTDIRNDREHRNVPCLTDNRLPVFISQIVNDGRKNSPTIQVHPVDDVADPKTANTFEGLIRQIEAYSNADQAYDTALEHAATGGFGYFRILTQLSDDDTFDQDIIIERVANPLTIFLDHRAKKYDKSDGNFGFVTEWMPKKEFEKKYPGKDISNWEEVEGDNSSEWINEDNVRIAEYWVREPVEREICRLQDGSVIAKEKLPEDFPPELVVESRTVDTFKVKRYLITAAEILEESDWAGKYIPIVPVYGPENFIEGKPVYRSAIRYAKDPQRLHNYWQSTITEKIALAPKTPFIGGAKAFEGYETEWGSTNIDSKAFLPFDEKTKFPPVRQAPAVMNIAEIQQSAQSINAIKATIGIFDPSLGDRQNQVSGKALTKLQQQGDNATFAWPDNLARSIGHGGRILIDLIPKIYDTDKQVRVLGADGKNEFVPINQVVVDSRTGKQVRLHDLAAGKYDYTVSTGPSYQTQRQESLDHMLRMVEARPELWGVIGDKIVGSMDFPDAANTAKRLRATIPQQILDAEKAEDDQPMPQQEPTPEQQADMAKAQADMKMAEAKEKEAQAKIVLAEAKMLEAQAIVEGIPEAINEAAAKAVAEAITAVKNQAA